jgi:hypothetical protein
MVPGAVVVVILVVRVPLLAVVLLVVMVLVAVVVVLVPHSPSNCDRTKAAAACCLPLHVQSKTSTRSG